MARLRQLNASNYTGSGKISAEFESVIRYLNAAELGNKTLAELMSAIFDDNGNFSGVVEIRKDASSGLQYRVGEYTAEEAEEGWTDIATLAELRGEAGENVGEIGEPIFYGRLDEEATSSQTEFDYAHTADDELLVYVDGVLQREGASNDYTTDEEGGTTSAGSITFGSAMSGGEIVSIFKVRAAAASGYTRVDTYTAASQAVFPFVHDENTRVLVYKNGILQREGGSYDYTTSPTSDTITFTSTITSGNLITFLTVENPLLTAVSGLMMEEAYVDAQSGLIPYAKIAVSDDDIAQAKVSGLASALSAKAKLTVSAIEPSGPAIGDLWVDTSATPDALRFYDGTDWLRTTPDASIPDFVVADANKVLRINGTGLGTEWAAPDYSSLIPITQKGAASGVATLDSSAKVPSAQLPSVVAQDSFFYEIASPSATTVLIERVWKQSLSLTGISVQTASGTCSVQVSINGVPQGSTYAASSSVNSQTFITPIDVDATTDPRSIQLLISSVSSAADLEVVLTFDRKRS